MHSPQRVQILSLCFRAIWVERNLLTVCILLSCDISEWKKLKMQFSVELFCFRYISMKISKLFTAIELWRALESWQFTAKSSSLIKHCENVKIYWIPPLRSSSAIQKKSHAFCHFQRYIGKLMMLQDVTRRNKNQKYHSSVLVYFTTWTKWKIAAK